MSFDELRARFAAVPLHAKLGLELVSRSPEEAVVALPVGVDLVQAEGVVQGGVLAVVADAAAVMPFHPDLPDDGTMTGTDASMTYLRPATAPGDPLVARARVLRRGRRVGVSEVDLCQGERLVARGTFTFLFLPRGADGASSG